MRIFICCIVLTINLSITSFAQNVGIGTAEPSNKLQVHGSLVVTEPTTTTSTSPAAAQIKTMVNASTITFPTTDSTGRIYDPGGAAGNYIPNLTANANINGTTSSGFEITLENIDLASGDSLIIKQFAGSTTPLLALGNGYNTPGKWILNSLTLYIIFKSNGDANVGTGFSLLFRRLYTSTTQTDVRDYTGNAFFFDTRKGILRGGQINLSAKGVFSTALGYNATASGDFSTGIGYSTNAVGESSTALGYSTYAEGVFSIALGNSSTADGYSAVALGAGAHASGTYSTAIGFSTNAGGDYSTATGRSTSASGDYSMTMGFLTTASGNYSTAAGSSTSAGGSSSTAMGFSTTASGGVSTAMGSYTTASGDYSTAMGRFVSTNNQEGSFVIGDASTSTIMNSPAPNNFRARFDNGYRLYTSSDYSTSCSLGAGDNAWTTTSDMRLKENFENVNGEDFLKKIATMQLVSWNYKKQDPAKYRHYGPMAQEFYAAFGKDKYGNIGNDTTINQADFDGVNLIAIQALEKRTQKIEQIEKMNNDLRKENTELKEMILLLRKEMDELKKQFLKK